MRPVLIPIASTVGSVAFQMSVDAGYIRHFVWAIPWIWGLCAFLWLLWLISHPKIQTGFHWKFAYGNAASRNHICIFARLDDPTSVGQKLVDVLPRTGFGRNGHFVVRQIIAGTRELTLITGPKIWLINAPKLQKCQHWTRGLRKPHHFVLETQPRVVNNLGVSFVFRLTNGVIWDENWALHKNS